MSLMRLLTATRSISDVKNEPSPYRMSQQGLLPKFGPREKARGDARPPSGSVTGDGKENLGEGNGDRTDAGCSLKSESSREPMGNAERGTRSAEPGRLVGWWQKMFRRRPRRYAREAVQVEFTLDLVKVVRNDLSDAEETRNAATSVAAISGARKKEKTRSMEHQPVEESVFGAPVR